MRTGPLITTAILAERMVTHWRRNPVIPMQSLLLPTLLLLTPGTATREGLAVAALVARIDAERIKSPTPPGLASAIRVWLVVNQQ